MNHVTILLLGVLFLISGTTSAKTLLENCTDNKLKEYKTKNQVTIREEPTLLRKFRAECAKTTFTTPAEKQALAAEAQAAEKEAKTVVNPPPATTPVAPTSASAQVVFGGCGTEAQCAASMKEASTPKYTWTTPGLQAHLGEQWGISSEAFGVGGAFEQPENACNDTNQGQIIGIDLGTEVIGVACMSSMSTQEEIKKMNDKIKTIKAETLLPTVIAVKKPKYEWKVILEPQPLEGQFCTCTLPGSCNSENLGKEFSEHSCCPTKKCVRTDPGGPVKPKSDKSKP